MSETLTDGAPSESVRVTLTSGFRIDPPHVLIGSASDQQLLQTELATIAPPLESDADPAPLLTVGLIQQLRSQAEQLSAHLRTQENDLEQREEVLNARLAEIENQTRAARLWVRERQAELREQEDDLQRRTAELDGRWTRGKETASAALRGQPNPHELAKRDASLAVAEAELQASQERLQAEIAAFAATRLQWLTRLNASQSGANNAARLVAGESVDPAEDDDAELRQALDQFLVRQQYLDQAESLLQESQQQLADERHELEFDRAQHDKRMQADRRALTLQQRDIDADAEKKRQSLDAQAEKLQTRRTALDELRTDLTRMHRETLEMRLVVEELWAQMAGAVPPAALTMALGQTRTRLAQQNRALQEQSDQEKQHVEAMAARISQQHDKLAVQRRDLQAWLQSQQAELHEQARRLTDREQLLEREETERLSESRAWQQERTRHQAELRKLLDQLRRPAA